MRLKYLETNSFSYFPVFELVTFVLSLIVPISAHFSGVNLLWVSVILLFFYLTSFVHAHYITVTVDHIRLVPLIFFLRTKNIHREQVIKMLSVEDFTVENNFPIGIKKYKLYYRSDRNKETVLKFSIQNRKKEKAILERIGSWCNSRSTNYPLSSYQ